MIRTAGQIIFHHSPEQVFPTLSQEHLLLTMSYTGTHPAKAVPAFLYLLFNGVASNRPLYLRSSGVPKCVYSIVQTCYFKQRNVFSRRIQPLLLSACSCTAIFTMTCWTGLVGLSDLGSHSCTAGRCTKCDEPRLAETVGSPSSTEFQIGTSDVLTMLTQITSILGYAHFPQ